MASNEVGFVEQNATDSSNNVDSYNEISNLELTTSIAEEYLNSVDVKACSDPKLNREKEKLEDLLKSYKKLIHKLDSRFSSEEEKKKEEQRLSKLPEIYAVLHPEIYHNPREDEKNRLIEKFSKRQFSAADRVIPPTCRTPIVNINDKRQEEKERFIKIISTCPARFHNTVDSPVPLLKTRRKNRISLQLPCPRNEREVEKERLSRILSTSGTYYRKKLDNKSNPPSFRKSKQDRVLSSTFDCNQHPSSKANMVRTGEYSPLTSKGSSNFLHGLGEHEERRAQLVAERRKEFKEQIDSAKASQRNVSRRVDKALSTTDLNGMAADEVDSRAPFPGVSNQTHLQRTRCSSTSTQTDPPYQTDPFYQLNGNITDINENDTSEPKIASFQDHQSLSPRDLYYLSPREKLMSDLHGVSHCFPGISPKVSPREDAQDMKLRQVAYAKALQEQIDEKRRIEEARKHREKEEEDLIEQRMRMQQQKLENELNDEERRKQDWLAQRESHEEVLRRRMLELELEAQELKKIERRKLHEVNGSEQKRESIRSRPLPPPQSTHSQPATSLRRPPERVTSESPRVSQFEGLRMAPLLEADRQNILTTNGLSPHLTPSRFNTSFKTPSSKNTSEMKDSGEMKDTSEMKKMSVSLERDRAEELLKAPLDFRIERPPSPPIPAVKTRGILSGNSKVLDTKWEVPQGGKELKRTQQGGNGRENILTQLGAFRRQLHREHEKLEARLQRQQTP